MYSTSDSACRNSQLYCTLCLTRLYIGVCRVSKSLMCSLLHLECHCISISNLNLLGLCSTARDKRVPENEIIDWDLTKVSCTAYCIWSVMVSFSKLNQSFKSLVPRSVEKRPRRLRLEIELKWHSKCNRLSSTAGCRGVCRVSKCPTYFTARCRVVCVGCQKVSSIGLENLQSPYLYRSFSAKEPYIYWLFCGKWSAT